MGCGTGGNELDGSTDFIIANKINKIKTSPFPNEKHTHTHKHGSKKRGGGTLV
jgi:hypothetical protein